MPKTAENAPFYKLRVTLDDTEPPVWREVVVRSGVTLDVLHEVLQTAMGWMNTHPHMLRIGKVVFAPQESDFGMPVRDEAAATIDDVARLASRTGLIEYDYDFGDGWHHLISVNSLQEEATLSRRRALLAWCVGGARACPPEDCGGIPGYLRLVEAMADVAHTERAELVEWLGGVFDPELFDLDGTNRILARIRQPR